MLVDREKRWAAVELSKIKEKKKVDKIREEILNSQQERIIQQEYFHQIDKKMKRNIVFSIKNMS